MLPFELKKAISTLQLALDSQEKVSLASFANKLQKVSANCPEDQTIGQMALIVDRMNSGERLFISRAEVKDLYKKLYTTSTKFADLFSDELGIEKTASEEPVSITDTNYVPFDIYSANDASFVSDLTSMFDPAAVSYSKASAGEAEAAVASQCSYPGLVPSVKAVSGTADNIVVSASYQTPRGVATLNVPVEIVAGRAVSPSYFAGKDGSHYISRKSVASYVRSYFEKSGSFGNIEAGASFGDLVEPQNTEEVKSLSQEFESATGIAHFAHGNKVDQARVIIANRLRSMGKRGSQVAVLDSSDNSITYGVSCGGISFKVPVKIEAGRLLEPTVILCKGSIESFDQEGVESFQNQSLNDAGISAAVSPLFDIKPSQLVEVVRAAAGEENYAKAEDALNVLSESGDEKAYQIAFAEYSAMLSGVKKEASTQHKCSMVVRSSASTQPICGHLNLPLNKVAQDDFGNCVPNHRKEMMDSNQGSYFMHSKILL